MPFSAIISSMDSRKSLLGSDDVFTTAKLCASGGCVGVVVVARAVGLPFLHAARRGLLVRVLRRRRDDTDERLGLPVLMLFSEEAEAELALGVISSARSTCFTSAGSHQSSSLLAGLVTTGRSTLSGVSSSSSAPRSMIMSASDVITLTSTAASSSGPSTVVARRRNSTPRPPSLPMNMSRRHRELPDASATGGSWWLQPSWSSDGASTSSPPSISVEPNLPTLCRLLLFLVGNGGDSVREGN
ncbi:Os05g0477100 [Oryza sativa Japonica Group]|uniref:Os05g0477100 protein n=2 Tax=Oryza sativa subsp. japonica TaxID=39947 RepID=Q0DHC0_ORYSJ|nr:hypothetical protein EE612_030181 [Oryza sativa]BAF17753.1 Os05g0477100 [Oryza sativa Japonica Group]BAS94541.1 Os05g0477100 [Oryza sativa Japonica Group]|eukprot:NP_001055839.1 Os05g0477100 [Oryza sativa Japonica Group]